MHGRIKTFRSRVLLLCSLLPAIGALVYATSSPELPPLKVTTPRPALVFATYLFHHGDEPVPLSPTLDSEFRFRNDGKAPVTIDRIERSCSCMEPRLSSKVIAPGEYGSVVVPVQTLNQSPGPHEFSLIVHYRDPQPRQTTLTVKAVFPEKMVVVQPTALFISQATSQPADFSVTVSDFREHPLTVSSASATAWFVEANLQRQHVTPIVQTAFTTEAPDTAATTDAQPEDADDVQRPTAVTKISGAVQGNIPPGRHHVVLTAETDDPEFPVVTVPMLINGPAYQPGRAPTVSPPHVQLVASAHRNARRRVQVTVTVPADWDISHASAWPEEIETTFTEAEAKVSESAKVPAAADAESARKTILVDVILSRLPQFPVTDGVVQLVANDGANLVTIPLMILQP